MLSLAPQRPAVLPGSIHKIIFHHSEPRVGPLSFKFIIIFPQLSFAQTDKKQYRGFPQPPEIPGQLYGDQAPGIQGETGRPPAIFSAKSDKRNKMKQSKRILIVDDDLNTRVLLTSLVESLGHDSEEARDGFEALAMVKLGFDLVLLDISIPGIDGLEVLRQTRGDESTEDLPVVMVSGIADKENRLRAFNAGASDFLTKPVDLSELAVRSAYLLKMKETQDMINRNRLELEDMPEKRTAVLRKALEELAIAKRIAHNAHLETIQRLAIAAEFKDKDTAAHIKRLGSYCALLGRGLDLTSNEIDLLFHATPMHDVGKLGIPNSKLLKPGKLDEDEWRVMKQHTVIGARILSDSESDLLKAGEVIAMSHHERWDGARYPNGLAEGEIPVWGRICAVADVFDALTSRRPYKEAFTNETAYEMTRPGRGKHFDPKIVDVFFDKRTEVEEIQESFRHEPILKSLAS